MSTSDNREFNLDVSELIEEAYELIGLELRTGYDLQRARRSLNLMLKEWGNHGINLWTVERNEDILYSGQSEVVMSSGELDVIDCVVRYQNRDYPVERITQSDYLNLPSKSQRGRPTQFYVDRQIEPVIFIWPTPPTNTYALVTYRVQQVQDVDSASENVDVPTQFLPAAVAGLAYYMAMKLAPERLEIAKAHYSELLDLAVSENTERGSLFIRPSSDCYC